MSRSHLTRTLQSHRNLYIVAVFSAALGCARLHGLLQGAGFGYATPPVNYPQGIAEMRWQIRLADPSDLDSRPRFRGTPAYDREHDMVYVGSMDHGLHAIRGRDGADLWRFQTLGVVEGTPVVANGTVYFGSDDGALYAIDARTGSLRWRVGTVAEVIRAPIVTADDVYFVNSDDTVLAVHRADGTIKWRYRRPPPGGITVSGHAGLLHLGNRIVTGFSDGNIVAIETSDGSVGWERDTSADNEIREGANEGHRAIDVDTTPVYLDGVLYAASYSAGLYALDPGGGGVRWREEGITDVSSIATDGRYLFGCSATLGLIKLDPSDGHVIWDRDLGSRALQEVSFADGYLAVPTGDDAMWLVRPSDGEPIEGLLRDGESAAALASGRDLMFSTNTGVLYAYRLLSH